jgi:Domain of unknown function (DUF4272)
MTPDERKAKTEEFLRKEGIPILPSLPCIESEEETELRTPEEIGTRIYCLDCVIGTAFRPDEPGYKENLKKHELWHHLTPKELEFLSDPNPDRRTLSFFTWRCEALLVLLWAVGLVDGLPFPDCQTDTELIYTKFPTEIGAPWPFIRGLKLRSKTEILDTSDYLYRLHWAVREADLKDRAESVKGDIEVVMEWHHAINWITKYEDQDWDDVTTDT